MCRWCRCYTAGGATNTDDPRLRRLINTANVARHSTSSTSKKGQAAPAPGPKRAPTCPFPRIQLVVCQSHGWDSLDRKQVMRRLAAGSTTF
jgi:hypothetical protein